MGNPWKVIANYRGRCAGMPSETIHVCRTYEEARASQAHHAFLMREYARVDCVRGTNLDIPSRFTIADLMSDNAD